MMYIDIPTSDTIDEFCKDHHINGIDRTRLDRLIRKEAQRIYELDNSFRYDTYVGPYRPEKGEKYRVDL